MHFGPDDGSDYETSVDLHPELQKIHLMRPSVQMKGDD